MSDTFTASNNIELRINDRGWVERRNSNELGTGIWDEISGVNTKHPALVWGALREFFQHERDKALGRWRWPENPDLVVYQRTPEIAAVLHEPSGQLLPVRVEEYPGAKTGFSGAANAYFATRAETKPWHDAKPGEIWVITTENVADEVAVQVTPEGTFQYNDGHDWPIRDMPIVSARRIFPEVLSE